MSKIYNSAKTADTINRAIDNSQGTTTTTQGASSPGLIITEDLGYVVQCTEGYTNPITVKYLDGQPPLTFHAVNEPLVSWIIDGNTVEGESVGVKSLNLFDENDVYFGDWIGSSGTVQHNQPYAAAYGIDVTDIEYLTVYAYGEKPFSYSICLYNGDTFISRNHITGTSTGNVNTISVDTATKVIVQVAKGSSLSDVITHDDVNSYKMFVVEGEYASETLPPYEPYGYTVPIECGNVTTTFYISDVLRKSSGEDPVYDTMSSSGEITRRVDTDGTPLETPITEFFSTEPIPCIWGYNTFDVDTTVTPSYVSIEYLDN